MAGRGRVLRPRGRRIRRQHPRLRDGTDGGVYENVLRAGAWSGWSALGGGSTSAPSAVARRATDLLDLVVRGTDNALHHRYFQPGAGWTG